MKAMKRILHVLKMLLMNSCAESTDKKKEVPSSKELKPDVKVTSKTKVDSVAKNSFEITFPLDSLLSFDSEKELQKVFGKNAKRSVGYLPEGSGEYANTVLFPNSKNEVEFVWEDDSIHFDKLAFIRISGKNTDWKTKEGITIGTGIKELESHNKRVFTFYGLGWDYSGFIDWNKGNLFERGIFGNLEYPGDAIPLDFEGLLGDQKIKSSSKLAINAKLVLRKLIMKPSN